MVRFYLGEMHKLDPILHGVIEVNPDALLQADKADRDRKAKLPGSLLGLHGIPILLKDNNATKDKMNTTAGSFALLKSVVVYGCRRGEEVEEGWGYHTGKGLPE